MPLFFISVFWHSSQWFFDFMILRLLKITSHLSSELWNVLQFVCVWWFLMIRFRLCIFSGKSRKWFCSSHCLLSGGARFQIVPFLVISMIIGLKWHLHYKIIVINYFLFFLICFFKPFIRAVICSQNDGEDGAHILHISLALTCAYPPSYQDPLPEWCIFMTDEPTVTHCYHSKSIVYFVVDFPCCTCYEFGQHMTIHLIVMKP